VVEPVVEPERVTIALSPEYSRIMGDLLSTPAFGADGGFDLDGLRQGMGTRREPEVAGICIEKVEAGGVPAQWVYLPDVAEAGRMLYLHGGGYVSGSGDFYLPLAAELARATGCALLLADYRLAPEHPHPAAVQDAVDAFAWMCAHGPRQTGPAAATFIGGDSAGGGLTLATLIALRDALPRYALPDAAATISAYTDLAHTGISVHARADSDPIMSPLSLPHFAAAYLNGADPYTPLASPLYADLHGLPPLLMQVGDCEIIRDDTVRMAHRARLAGVNVTLEVWDQMFHVWHSSVPILSEARAAIARIALFFAGATNP
jgi:acetyl esterase/lipase